eukprot:GHVU01234373.1.p1 GENE.GHVU01234373.1~~GHVU01234373.1.p1  ORF type:complete len:127 (-),score=8.12 GHVU01234373.1:87-467(-)
MVLCKWREGEIKWRNKLYEGQKAAPKWTEPKRVLKVLNTSNTQFLVRSIWYNQKERKYSRSDMKLVPESKYGSIRAANIEYTIQHLLQHPKGKMIPWPGSWRAGLRSRGSVDRCRLEEAREKRAEG